MKIEVAFMVILSYISPAVTPTYGSLAEPAATQKSSEICENYAHLLSSDFWKTESQKRAVASLRNHVDPLMSSLRIQLNLAGAFTQNITFGLVDGSIGLLELARAYDTMGCATANMILARIELQSKQNVTDMLHDLAKQVRSGADLDKYAPKLVTALTSLYKNIDKFEFQKDMPDFPMKEASERVMQAVTATHKAKGTLKYIALSARQYVIALHTDYLVRKDRAKLVLIKSSTSSNAPGNLNVEISSDYNTYVVIYVQAAQQWDTISFLVRTKGQPTPVSRKNIKGGEQIFVAIPVIEKTQISLEVFNGVNCKNTNWLPNRFSATISCLQRNERDSKTRQ